MAQRFHKKYRLIAILADLFTVVFGYFMAVSLRNYILQDQSLPVSFFDFPRLFFYIIIIWWLLLILLDAAEPNRFTSLKKEIRIGVITTLVGFAILLAIGFLAKYYFARSIILSFCFTFIILFIFQKVAVYFAALKLFEDKKISILIVGIGDRAVEFYQRLTQREKNNFKIVGFLDINKKRIGEKIAGNHCIIGSFRQLPDILKTYMIEEVFFILRPRHFSYIESLLSICAEAGITTRMIFSPGNPNPYKFHADSIAGYPTISYSRLPEKEFSLFTKRMIDIVASGLLLIILSPLFLIIAIVIKLTSLGPVFYPWKVVGQNNRDFVGYKFRTMLENADALKESLIAENEMNGPVFKMKKDPRITRVGKYLRKFSLDELPQLWSVLKGDMSLVGPRPPNRNELDRYEFWQRRKISFKPGITCLWQVKGRNSINDFSEWCKLDLEYIDNWSLWLDFKILAKTVWVVIRGTGC